MHEITLCKPYNAFTNAHPMHGCDAHSMHACDAHYIHAFDAWTMDEHILWILFVITYLGINLYFNYCRANACTVNLSMIKV